VVNARRAWIEIRAVGNRTRKKVKSNQRLVENEVQSGLRFSPRRHLAAGFAPLSGETITEMRKIADLRDGSLPHR